MEFIFKLKLRLSNNSIENFGIKTEESVKARLNDKMYKGSSQKRRLRRRDQNTHQTSLLIC